MRLRVSFLALAGAATLVATPGTAAAGPAITAGSGTAPTVRVLDSSVVAPYQLTAGRGGTVWVADGGLSRVSTLTRAGLTPVVDGPHPGEIAGVAVNARGDLAYTWTAFGPTGSYEDGTSYVTVRTVAGDRTVDLTAYEAAHNPDGRVRYGVPHPTACQQQAFAVLGGARYTGIVHTHPYAVAPLPGGAWAIADAAGNTLLRLGPTGRVSVIAVLPRQPVTITAAAAAALGMPSCAVGARYAFEPVPTDVELGPDGRLVVSLLPGGVGPQLGANGSVVSVDPRTGAVRTLARGFLGAVNVAVADRGRIFVSEFFGGRISVVQQGTVRPYVQLASPLGLLWRHGTLFAGTMAQRDEQGNPTAPGTLVAIC